MIGSLLILAAIVRAYLGLDNHTIIEQHVVSICISGWFHIGHSSLSMSHSKCIYVTMIFFLPLYLFEVFTVVSDD
jgi:hypothetical protein